MVLLLGVGIASVTDLQLNLLGSIIAVLTIAATCVCQIVSLFFLLINSIAGLLNMCSFFDPELSCP
jgi:hypothetical protein